MGNDRPLPPEALPPEGYIGGYSEGWWKEAKKTGS